MTSLHNRSVSHQSQSPTRVLSDYSARISISLDGTEPERGWRSISMKTFHSSSSEGSISIPDDFESDQCLMFLGFKKGAAANIMESYFSGKAEFSDLGWDRSEILELAKSYLSAREDTWKPDDDWNFALKGIGMRKEARYAILTPMYDDIRLLGTARSWAMDTVEVRWDFLKSLDRTIREKAQTLKPPPGDDRSISPTGPPSLAKRPAKKLKMAANTPLDPLIASEILIPPSEIPYHTFLFKGGLYSRFKNLVRPDGTLALLTIASRAPTDFSPTSNTLLYFTKHKDVVRRYAGYACVRGHTIASTGVLSFAVPSDVCVNAYEVVGQEWRDLVWISRRVDTTVLSASGRLPIPLRHISEQQLLIGPICGNSPDKMENMTDKSELEMVKTGNGEKASQHVFQGGEIIDLLAERCRDKVCFEMVSSGQEVSKQ